MEKVVYFAKAGIPSIGLTPSFLTLKKSSDGSNISQPSILEVGGGWYKLDINPTELTVGVIDSGDGTMSDSDRYLPFYTDINDYLFEVLVTPVYDDETDSLKFLVFCLQNGRIRTTALTNCDITVYDSSHVEKFTLNSTSFTNGVTVLTKSSPGLVDDENYYVSAEITLDGVIHSSLDTFISIE